MSQTRASQDDEFASDRRPAEAPLRHSSPAAEADALHEALPELADVNEYLRCRSARSEVLGANSYARSSAFDLNLPLKASFKLLLLSCQG